MPRLLIIFACLTSLAAAVEPDGWRQQWYDQGAEITRYRLAVDRYGETRHGDAVLIYVTEPVDARTGIKADNPNRANAIPSLKLNRSKTFLTGVYPYSIMSSIFQPIDFTQHQSVFKVSSSLQEWCGHVFVQLNRQTDGWKHLQRSYFESGGDINEVLPTAITEDGLWTQLRINPLHLPTGNISLIPSLEAGRLAHRPLKPETAVASLRKDANAWHYELRYSSIQRSLRFTFSSSFPWHLQGWTEQDRNHSATATMTHRQMMPYWQLNRDKDRERRRSLGLANQP